MELIGIGEIAELLHVQRQTVDVWRHRGTLPAPRTVLSGNPLWHKKRILRWATETGRYPKPLPKPAGRTRAPKIEPKPETAFERELRLSREADRPG